MPLILIPLIISALAGLTKMVLIAIALKEAEHMLPAIGLGCVLFTIGAIFGALAYRHLKLKYPSLP